MTLQTRFRAYNPDGTTLGVLDEPPTWDVSLPVNQVSAANFSYPLVAKRSEWLAEACEIALEIYDGSAWSEPANARYLRMVQSNDPTKGEADVVAYQMPGYAYNLDGVVVVPYADGGATENYDDEGKRKFLAATPGRILTSVLQEARTIDPDVRSGLSLGFSPTQDSSGAAWAKQMTIYYEPGMSLLTILENLSSQGIVDWVMQGRQLKVYNADTSLATRRDQVVVRGAEEESPTKSTLEGLRHIVMLRGDEGLVWLQQNANADTPWGKSMTVLNQGGIRDEGTALSLIGAELATGSKERTQYTRSVALDAATQIPLVDYFPGDYIKASGRTPTLESFRVFQITIRSTRSATLTLNDRFEDSLIRMAKRQKGIVNGAVGDAGTGSQPSGPNVGKRQPIAPSGLVVTSNTFIDKAGLPQAVATAGYEAQELGTDGLPLNLRAVQLWGWRTADDLPRQLTSSTDLSMQAFSPLPIGEDWSFRIRSVGVNGIASDFSNTVSITLSSDTTPPPQPSKPTASTRLGVVSLRWDGKTSNGTEMPVDFERIDVVQGPLPGNVIGTLGLGEGNDAFHVTDLPYNVQQEFWFVAVDTSQNRSPNSEITTAITKPLVDTDIIGKIIDGVNVKLETITAELIADQAINEQKLADNAVSLGKLDTITRDMIEQASEDASSSNGRVTTSQNEPQLADGADKPIGALWFRYDAAGTLLGTWLWDGTQWDSQQWGSEAIGDKAITQTKLDDIIINAIVQAGNDAEEALDSANGKNKIIYSVNPAIGTGSGGYSYIDGDTWFQKVSGIIVGQWQFLSGVWVAQTLDNAVIANLDAGKITAGLLDAARIRANSISADKITLGNSTNMVDDPSFLAPLGQAWTASTGAASAWTMGVSSSKGRAVQCNPTSADHRLQNAPNSSARTPVVPGERYYASADAFTDLSSGTPQIWVYFQDSAGGYVSGGPLVSHPGTGWAALSTEVVVPAAADVMFFICRVQGATSPYTGRALFVNPRLLRKVDAELIVDGSVTTRHIVAGSITAASGIIADAAIGTAQIANAAITNAKIATLDAGKITSGYIDSARIQANTITASMIAVGDFENVAGSWDEISPPWILGASMSILTDPASAHSGSKYLRIDGTLSGASTLLNKPNTSQGDEWYVEFWAFRNSSWNGTASNSKVRVADQNNSIIGAVSYGDTSLPANVWTKISGVVTISSATVSSLTVSLGNDATAGAIRIDDLIIRRRSTGELLVDGAITSRTIATGAVTANEIASRTIVASRIASNAITSNEIAALTITGNEIAANTITGAKIAALTVTAGEIAANAITADKINAGAITAVKIATDAITTTKLDATAITSKHTITGATIQTSSTALRGIKITTGGLTAYNSSGVITVDIDHATGNALFTGTIKNKPTGPRVQILSTDTQAIIHLIGAEPSGSFPAQIFSDPAGQSLFLRSGNPSSTTPIYSSLRLHERSSSQSWYLGRTGLNDAEAYPRMLANEDTFTAWYRSANAHGITLNPNGYTYLNGNGVVINGSLSTSGSKNFVMEHPSKEGMDLVHASTESPHNGVEYWSDGMVEMPLQGFKTITLPTYFEALTAPDHRVALLTAGSAGADLWAEPIVDGKLIVHGAPGALFSWLVKARRVKIVDGHDELEFQTERASESKEVTMADGS